MSAISLDRRRRRLATAAFTAFCLLACWLYRGTAPGDKGDGAMVLGMTVQTPSGDLLADPVVLSEQGQKVEVHLMCEEDPRAERMSLTLQPIGVEDGQLLYSYDLSVAGRVKGQRGTVRLTPGKERRIAVASNDSRGVTLSLFAAPLRAPSVERYLLRHKARRHPFAS